MSTLLQQVRHDAASMHQFLCSISDHCEHRSRAANHLSSSEQFFEYIVKFADATKKYLCDFPGSRTRDLQYLDFRDDVGSLRAGWQFIHRFIKPVLDADTLHLPTALLNGLIERFRQIPRYSSTNFVIYHTDEFNYFNVSVTVLKTIVDQISSTVGGPDFPQGLGVIGIPYSQASSLFMNCLIPHEMGHYVFGDSALRSTLSPVLELEITSQLGKQLPPLEMLALRDQLLRWAEEIFCDLFAVRLVGFCYSFAFIELFDTSKALDEKGTFTANRSLGMMDFDLYPPNLFRLKQHISILKSDAWWPEIKMIDSHYVQTLLAAEGIADTDFRWSNKIPGDKVLASFLPVIPKIVGELDKITSGLDKKCASWKTVNDEIQNHLEYGVVPSSLLSRSERLQFSYPDVVVLLNGAYAFYVQHLDKLLSHISIAEPEGTKSRSSWARKVETWTAKAIEDVTLLNGSGH